MRKFIEIIIMLTIAACSYTLAIMLAVCALTTELDSITLYVVFTMLVICGTIAFMLLSCLWHDMFK